ncbi:regulator of microtubule dynamics protein 1-like [Mizuhopecten yessoensis]|uniref:Regulator of microtubule dynamics protein 2 n=1 Tax=Mizuhopecten yessoensis TaxID=6573 RepID=A0A210R001_MIZYE|nr:regulator of microtubule dynamics protein 1-like [Mizuhopecten yessoensis]OWF54339.1 Regulator of microtubule dynamics protein 2 [Mizuhopecten yessoensis]
MSSFLRPNSPFFGALGTGIFIGLGGTILYLKITGTFLREIQRLSASISELKQEVKALQQQLESVKKRRRSPGFYSVHASSGDDDDEMFEDAYGGSGTVSSPSDPEFVESFRELNAEDIAPGQTNRQQSVDEQKVQVYEQVDQLLEGGDDDKQNAYTLLLKHKSQFLGDADYHWRLSKCTYQVAQIEGSVGNEDKKKEMVYSAKDSAAQALTLNEDCASAHKWFAITVGSIGDYEGTQAKIKNGYVFKEHIERAIQIKPDDPSSHHLLGRWCFGVYMLSWIERKAAAALYAAPPTSTADEALLNFQEAERLNPGKWKENMLFIAKCYIELRNYVQAVVWLEKAVTIPVVSLDDKTSQVEVETLLAKYRQ